MTEFNIDQYEITVSVDDDNDIGNSETNESDDANTTFNISTITSHDESDNEPDAQEVEPEIAEDLQKIEDTNDPSLVSVPLRPVSHPPKRKLPKEGELFSRWIFYHLYHHRNLQPEKIALIEEVSEARCVSYAELVDGAIKTANYMSHHGIKKGDRIAMCMENSVEYVFYQLGAYLLGAVPVLINPSHIAADKFEIIECAAAVVDFDNYGHILRVCQKLIKECQHVFVLAEDLSVIYIPPHVWIYDGFGFLEFPKNFKKSMPMKDGHVTIFSSSGANAAKPKFVAHSSQSSQLMVYEYFDKLFDLLVEKDPDYTSINGHHLITSGLHCHDAWSYLYYVLIKGETCVLAESTFDIWRASFLDRVAGLIEQYRIPLILANAQHLKCFVKYEVHNIYDITSLKIVANTGTTLSKTIAQKIKQMLNVSVTQAYSATEFGVVAYELFDESLDSNVLSCGTPFTGTQIFQIADLRTEREVEVGEWGQVWVSGNSLFTEYIGENADNDSRIKAWYRTGDYGMVDHKNRIHIGGPVSQLLEIRGKKMSPEFLESIMSEHNGFEDIVTMNNGRELWCGVLIKDDDSAPSIDELDKILKKHKVLANVSKIVTLDFIPRSENGKVLRNEIPYLMNLEHEETVVAENSESYI
ncbi:unnamed protein product [Caenorhabditis bovis]|uniref:AMP-dependent synthetase/ligase domain-containing protein n=1 Tax=Caenorhabditis bovis TaxID=2654633 RepID=A0A8S1EFH7_9PELO|nr:unnamed protein product [Caenorhabditis bovis]